MNDIELKQFMAERKAKQAAKAGPTPKDLRDEFAMAVLPAVYAEYTSHITDGAKSIAGRAYEIADAMMAARGKCNE